jgi:hypothetical protein
MQHPEEGTIHAWLDGALPEPEAAAIEAHAASCAECAARVSEARGLIAASSRIVSHLDAVPGNVIPLSTRRPRLFMRNPWLSGAIAAALLLAIGLYAGMPDFGGVRGLPPVAQTSKMSPTSASDSAIVTAPPTAIAPQPQAKKAASGDQRRSTTLADAANAPTLPPANAAVQKSAPAAEPAPVRAAPLSAMSRAEVQTAETRSTAADASRQARNRAAGGAALGAVVASSAAPPPPAMAAQRAFNEAPASAAAAFAGCYEMSASTDVLPARFALVNDSAAISGLLAIHYVDADGRSTSRIQDLGWALEGDHVIVKTQAGQTLLTLRKTGSAVSAEGRSGSRNGRVVSCSR